MTRRVALALVLILTVNCGGASGPVASIFALKSGGSGDSIVTRINTREGSRWLYRVETGNIGTSSENFYQGTVQIPDGPLVPRLVTESQVVFQEQNESGQYYWGSSDGDLLETPLVTLSYPLKLDRRWSTGTKLFPEWYQYSVEGVETVETPAGTFQAARLVQFNSRSNQTVTRWYAESIGLVARKAETGNGITTTLLLRYQLEN